MNSTSNYSKIKVDAASAFTAVCAYHPWRTLASRAMENKPFTINPMQLYAGFVSGVMASHQLFVMASVHREMHERYGALFASMAAGIASAPSTAVCDAWNARARNPGSISPRTMAIAFRGFTPTVFRQMGLSAGMFVFPPWIERKCSSNDGNSSKMPYAFAGGFAAIVITQYPDTVRAVMQQKQQIPVRQACHEAFQQMTSHRGVHALFWRVCVLGTAFTTMQWGREHYPKVFNKEENRS
jgi:hypothetical protein